MSHTNDIDVILVKFFEFCMSINLKVPSGHLLTKTLHKYDSNNITYKIIIIIIIIIIITIIIIYKYK
jgi:hypothetical protein